MKSILATLTLIIICLFAKAQQSTPSLSGLDTIHPAFNEKIYSVVDQSPTFPGGFYNYIQRNLRYPLAAEKDKIEGDVLVSFVIENDGSVSGIRITKSLSKDCDSEAIRLLQECPNWSPGKQKGKPVRVQYSFPIKFEIR